MSVACCPPGYGSAANPGREVADELDAPSACQSGPVRSAASRSRSAGVRMVGMCARSVRGLLDWRRRSVVDDVRWARGSWGTPWSLLVSSWKTTRRAAGGGVRLRRQEGLEFLVSFRCFGVLPCHPEV